MDQTIFVQYGDIKEEIKDIRRRIGETQKYLNSLQPVADTVKGTRRDGTIGNIKVTGFPAPEYYRKKKILDLYRIKLEKKELELLELTNHVEEYIEGIEKSELRIMFRLYYIDDLNWVQVAIRMNDMFPKRQIKYTDDNCWRRNKRFFENVGPCRAKT